MALKSLQQSFVSEAVGALTHAQLPTVCDVKNQIN